VRLGAVSGSSIEIVVLHSGEVKLLGQIGKQPSLVFSPGGKSLASASGDARCEIQVWNLQTGQMRVLKGAWSGPRSIAFSPDGRQIAAADSDLSNPSIRLWDLETGTMRVLGGSTRQITSIGFLAGGSELASGSWDETVRLWNVRTGEASILGENCSCVCRMAISIQSDKLAAYSLDGRIRIWDLESGRSRTIGEYPGVNTLSFLTDSTRLITGSDDGALRLWSTNI
jgi:WD40 repeat protein